MRMRSEPPVDPVLDQLTGALRALGHEVDTLPVDRDVRAARDAVAERAARSRRSTSPSRSTGRARSSRTSTALLNLLDLRYTGSSPAGLIARATRV